MEEQHFINSSLVRFLLDKGLNIDGCDYLSQTALVYSLTFCSYASLAVLIEKGADVNYKDIFGNSALHYAVMRYRDTVIFLLIKYGALFSTKNSLGMTPLDYVIESKNWLNYSHFISQIQGNSKTIDYLNYGIKNVSNRELIKKFQSILNKEDYKDRISNNKNNCNIKLVALSDPIDITINIRNDKRNLYQRIIYLIRSFLSERILKTLKTFICLKVYFTNHRINF
jgi:ankyrin repeat protein